MTLQFSNCHVEIEPRREFLVTVFNDGSRCEASPHDTHEYFQTAERLGYGNDVWACCVAHELLHTLLAENRGEPYSQTLWDVAHGEAGKLEHAEEESRVLTFQKRWNDIR